MPVLVPVGDLHDLVSSGGPVSVLDVRWTPTEPDGLPAHLAGHVPGAIHVDLDRDLASHGAPTDGRHPLPDPADLQASARRWGLRHDVPVVVYDDVGGMSAARAWWVLRWAGMQDVRILDGGLAAWRDAGHPLATGPGEPVAPSDIVLGSGHLPTITIDEAAAFPGTTGVLLDARSGERYRGEVEPLDPRAGHVPGAVSAPTTDVLDADGRFLPPDALAARFDALGARQGTPVAVYCGSGVTAAHTIAALAAIGREAALFPGSWSAWSNHPDRPAATGPEPDSAS